MKRNVILTIGLALLTACGTTPPTPTPEPPTPAPVRWVPQKGERVATNYCQDCTEHIGRPGVVTLTDVVTKDGKVTVFAKEFPKAGLPVSWVTKWQ